LGKSIYETRRYVVYGAAILLNFSPYRAISQIVGIVLMTHFEAIWKQVYTLQMIPTSTVEELEAEASDRPSKTSGFRGRLYKGAIALWKRQWWALISNFGRNY
jgi:hypothetical protein